jgi:hypothetical protein
MIRKPAAPLIFPVAGWAMMLLGFVGVGLMGRAGGDEFSSHLVSASSPLWAARHDDHQIFTF